MFTAFEPGAPTPQGFIPLCVPEIKGNERLYIGECLDTGWVSSVGSFVERFENELAKLVGTEYAVATVNGTAALHIALLVAGIQREDEVLVSTLSFIAPAYAICYVGAHPVFIDAEPEYWQMDPAKVLEFLENNCRRVNGELQNKITGRRVKAIMPVHILGHPVDMDAILQVAQQYKLTVIEDASESIGAQYKGRPTGSMGEIACFSFNGNKLLTTGGGGMIITNNPDWAKKARYLTTQAKDDPLEYIHNEIGYNYRLTNIQAAMGCAQLERLEEYIAAKRRIAETYAQAFRNLPGITPMQEASWARSIFWMLTVKVDKETYKMDSRALLRTLATLQIQTRPLWQPLHLNRPFVGEQVLGGGVAEHLNWVCLSLPCSVGLTIEQQQQVIWAIKECYKK